MRQMSMEKLGKRIIILGCPGSGKSTFARALSARTGIPLVHLDNIWWRPDRTHITREEFDLELEALMRGESWILDGDYSRTYELRFKGCDTVIFLDYSEEECVRGVTERLGRKRTDIPWAEDTLDPELMEMVINYRRDNRPEVYSLMERYKDKRIVIFSTRAQAEDWLNGLCLA